jgi:hypothetical protein
LLRLIEMVTIATCSLVWPLSGPAIGMPR